MPPLRLSSSRGLVAGAPLLPLAGVLLSGVLLSLVLLSLTAGPALATPLTVDQIIYQSAVGTTVTPSALAGTIDVTASGNTLTILLTNTSPDAAFVGGGAPSTMLLSGVGIQLGGLDIVGGSVSVAGGSTALNFGTQGAPDISNQWLYANQSIDGFSSIVGAMTVDTVLFSVNNGQGTRFAGPPPTTLDGPDFGALSAFESEFGTSQEGVRDTIQLVLTLDGTAPDPSVIDAGNVVLAFGSPEALAVPEPGTALLLGLGLLLGLTAGRRRR